MPQRIKQCTRRYNRKVDLQTRLDGISIVTSPEVNDKDNGILDTVQLTEAQEAIEQPKAKQAVDSKLTEITSDGLINPSEKAELDKTNWKIKPKQMPQRN
ncbi:hypothetical protein J4710_08570 [Staphylococcus xylosus]|uniref:Minor extracellular protease Epr GA-like domain-containing protein n=1 Tax=Staphylococcus xylosus TaxID=1288 RepID=A0A939NLX3_STAXY|nr:hypothetical protein [Staphylococcus xylosus]